MLQDPIAMGIVTSGDQESISTAIAAEVSFSLPTGVLSFATSDIGPGSSKRNATATGGNPALLSISHSTSNENKPFQTDRSVIRVDLTKVNATSATKVTMSAYLVVTLPQSGDFSQAEALELARSLCLFALCGAADAGVVGGSEVLARVIAGEP